jgi:rare lipoprotein A
LPADAAPLPVIVETSAGAPAAAGVTAPVVAVTGDLKGLFLQLGAFGTQDNAETYLTRLKSQVDWLAPALHVYPKDGLFRVHAGPYTTQADARAAAERIGQALGIKAMVLTR